MHAPHGRSGASDDERASRAAQIASDVVFYGLLALSIARTLHHAMWRDELQIFQLGANSTTLRDLYHHLAYEAHGGLWDTLVWLLTRVATDPVWMQVLNAAVASAIWILVYRGAPFSRIEKILLLLSYTLFFEFFVISRSYGLAALLGLGFVALRQYRRSNVIAAWLLLGLLANLVAHATIWSIALAVVFVLEERRRDARFVAGAGLYLALLAFGIFTMMPAPDYGPWNARPTTSLASLDNALTTMLGAFVPIDPDWFATAKAFLADPHNPVPFVWNPNPIHAVIALTGAGIAHPLRLAALLLIPIGLCVALTRNAYRVLAFSLAYLGIMTFAVSWHFPGSARHHGLVFVAFVASVWAGRAAMPVSRQSWLFGGILGISALGGILSLGAELTPFSQSRNAARWIGENAPELPLIGSRDAQVSSVAGYLGRPVYYLECACIGSFIVWNGRRQSPLSPEQVRERLARALSAIPGDAIVIRNKPMVAEEIPAGARTALLQSFDGATTDENYWVYRVTGAKP